MFQSHEFVTSSEKLTYHLYVPNSHQEIDSLLVYVHGLMSDRSWFQIPGQLPEKTGILYISRQPKQDVVHFMQWVEHYRLCLAHALQQVKPKWIHLVANCFGSLPALIWVTKQPETFTTVTLSNPILAQKRNFSKLDRLRIGWNGMRSSSAKRKIYLTPRDFTRLPHAMNFIMQAPDTSFAFTDRFFLQVLAMRKWLHRNLIDVPVPVHTLFAYEDEVVNMQAAPTGFWKRVQPSQTTFFHTDHYMELLPQREAFWDRVIRFQQQHECQQLRTDVRCVLVTGATGFLGRHIIRTLMDSHPSIKVIAWARNKDNAKRVFARWGSRVEVRVGDLNDLSSIETASAGVDAVIHTAGTVGDWGSIDAYRKTNVEGTKNLLMIAHSQGIKQFVLISSLGVFGDEDQDDLDENTQMRYTSDAYSNSKIEQEFFVRKYARQNHLPYTIIRPGFIYGDGDHHFMPRLQQNIRDRKLKFIGDGRNYLNTVYVHNVCVLVGAVLGNPSSFYESYNLTDYRQVTAFRFVSDVCNGLQLPVTTKHISLKTALRLTTILERVYRTLNVKVAPPITRKKVTFMARNRLIDSSKSYRLIGTDAVDYEEGMRQTLNTKRPDDSQHLKENPQ